MDLRRCSDTSSLPACSLLADGRELSFFIKPYMRDTNADYTMIVEQVGESGAPGEMGSSTLGPPVVCGTARTCRPERAKDSFDHGKAAAERLCGAFSVIS